LKKRFDARELDKQIKVLIVNNIAYMEKKKHIFISFIQCAFRTIKILSIINVTTTILKELDVF